MADVREAVANSNNTSVTLVTTAETVIITSDPLVPAADNERVLILAWCNMATGTGTTNVTPRLYRGTGVTGTLLGSAVAEGIKAAVGGHEPFFFMWVDNITNLMQVQYTFSLQQTGASANGATDNQAIAVFAL
jgi:hypothetical protein